MAGPSWTATHVGNTIRVWMLEVDGTRFFVVAETSQDANAELKHEIQQIVGSIRFA